MGRSSAETERDGGVGKTRLDLVKQVLQELNQEKPKKNYQGESIPTATERWGPLAAWVIYCSGSGAENEHLQLIGAPRENGRERGYIFTPDTTLLIAHPDDPQFETDKALFNLATSKLGEYTLLGGLVDSLAYAVTGGAHLSSARIAFNWCREDPHHDTIGYATLHRLRRAIVERYDAGLAIEMKPETREDPGNLNKEPRPHAVETRDLGYHRPFFGSAEFHWEQRFPSVYPIIKRLEALAQAETRQP